MLSHRVAQPAAESSQLLAPVSMGPTPMQSSEMLLFSSEQTLSVPESTVNVPVDRDPPHDGGHRTCWL